MGTPVRVPTKKRSLQKENPKLPKAAVYSVLSALLPPRQAADLAGLSPKHKIAHINVAPYQVEVNDIRKKLAELPGMCSYLDQIVRAVEIRDDEEVDTTNRLAAIKEINKMQGYLAPVKMEMEQRVKISGAVMELKAIIGSGITPQAILEEKKRREIAFQEVKPQQIGCSNEQGTAETDD